MKIYLKDLPCRQETTPEGIERYNKLSNNSYDLDRMPNESLRNDFAAFIFDRASGISIKTCLFGLNNFHRLGDFLTAYYPHIEHLTDVPLDDLTNKLKRFLVKKGYKLSYSRHWLDNELNRSNSVITYLKKSYEYFTSEKGFKKEHDKWRTIDLPFELRASPLNKDKLLDFTRIKQEEIKDQVKEGALYRLKRVAPGTVIQEVYSMNYLSEYLSLRHPDISTLADFNREVLEDYLAYKYLENNGKTCSLHELQCLKSILSIIGRIFGFDNLRGIFLKTDFPSKKRTIFKSYSDAELARLHEGYKTLDKQTARVMLIHELLGLRISDTLTLRTEDVVLTDEPYIIIHQPKTNNTYEKKINSEIAALLSASIEYDKEHYGECEYIFVSEKDHSIPMKYPTLQGRLLVMIHRLDLRDDNGNLFTAGTHILRHTYGKRLCDLLNDDATIAALLGHTSLKSVACYRKMSPNVLAETSKPAVDKRNDKIKQFKKGWME